MHKSSRLRSRFWRTEAPVKRRPLKLAKKAAPSRRQQKRLLNKIKMSIKSVDSRC